MTQVSAGERYQLEIRLKLQPIASHHLSELIRSDDKRERMCKMAGELFDAMAEMRFRLVETELDATRFADESRLYLSQVVLPWFDGVPLNEADREAIQVEIANRRIQWLTKALLRVRGVPEMEAPSGITLIRRFMEEEGYGIADLAKELGASREALSSVINGGKRHGRKLLVKLANRMKVEPEILIGPSRLPSRQRHAASRVKH
jgi:antitoxin component HigA of HigAB toxin-antitoxin module